MEAVVTELDPEARALIDRARPAEDATPEDRARIQRRLAQVLGAAAIGVAAHEVVESGVQSSFAPLSEAARAVGERTSGEVLRSAAIAAKSAGVLGGAQAFVMHAAAWIAGGALLGGAAFLTLRAVNTADEPEPVAVTAAPRDPKLSGSDRTSRGDAPAEATREAAPQDDGSLVPQPEPLTAPPPIRLEDLPVLPPGASARADVRSSGSPREATRRPAPTASSRAGSSLAEEARGLAAVHEALRAGDPTLALSRLDAMDRRPGGVLGEERLVARVLALCGLGRVEEAGAIARRVQKVAPESPLLPRLRGSCAKDALTP